MNATTGKNGKVCPILCENKMKTTTKRTGSIDGFNHPTFYLDLLKKKILAYFRKVDIYSVTRKNRKDDVASYFGSVSTCQSNLYVR